MTILDRANAFIGHEEEVDEGYETTMRRNAFIAGFKEALGLVKEMREAQKDYQEWVASFDSRENIEYRKFKMERFESEVDELIKEL